LLEPINLATDVVTIADLLAVTLAEVNAGETKQQLCTNSRWWRLRRIAAAFEPPAMPVSDGSAESNNKGQNEAQAYHLNRRIVSTVREMIVFPLSGCL
jgi:hypothetical protein